VTGSATRRLRLVSVLSPEDLSVMRKQLADAVPVDDRSVRVEGVDLVAAYDAMEEAGELMRQWEASGQWMHGGDVDGCEGTLS
jgi:hypothetical protein